MFHSAILRLTLWYLGLVMLLSGFFSVALYRVSTNELSRTLGRQTIYFHNLPNQFTIDFNQLEQLRQQQIEEIRERIKIQLIYFNLGLLVVSGLASYWLARRTLAPIQDALDAQTRFTADASHELRTPLAAMKAEIEVALRDKQRTTKDLENLVTSNLEEIHRLESLTSNLLKLAGHNGSLPPSAIVPVAVASVINQAVARLRPLASQKAIKIETHLTETIIEGDQASLTEVVVILIDNAIKYSPEKSRITIETTADQRTARIRVIDTGFGIAARDLPHIFDRFYRADPSRTNGSTGGHGLGLAIARKIIDLHHGQIDVTSTPGTGSIFTIRLPLHDAR